MWNTPVTWAVVSNERVSRRNHEGRSGGGRRRCGRRCEDVRDRGDARRPAAGRAHRAGPGGSRRGDPRWHAGAHRTVHGDAGDRAGRASRDAGVGLRGARDPAPGGVIADPRTITVLVGAPASGKTTLRRRLVAGGCPPAVVSLDDERVALREQDLLAGRPPRPLQGYSHRAV